MAIKTGFLEYGEHPWGDLLYGDRDTLQLIGIGSGLPFPGEAGGNRRLMRVSDPRGFPCRVEKANFRGDGVFLASIQFPGREPPDCFSSWADFSPGVSRREAIWTDEYLGDANSLVLAGVVPTGRFPGMPGMNKVSQKLRGDGMIIGNITHAERAAGSTVGFRTVTIANARQFLVKVDIDRDIGEERQEALRRATDDWTARMMLLPRPPRIDGPYRQARDKVAQQKRELMKLVWTRPAWSPSIHQPSN